MSCPACGGPLERWRSVRAGEPADPARYELLRCGRCGSAVTAGEAPGAEAYEAGWYAERPPRGRGAIAAAQGVVDRQAVSLLRRAGVPSGARVLDAGAGRGRLVGALRAAGFDASGIEPSRRGVESATAAGLPVAGGSIEEHSGGGLDAVVLWHVLEHLPDPAAALRRVASWLRPGGVVLVGAPNLGSVQAAIAGDAWFHFDVPRHRTHLTVPGLRALFGRSGLEPGPVTHMVWEQNPAGMWLALLTRLGMTPGFPLHLLKRNVPARPRDLGLLAAGAPLLPVAVALEAAAAAAGRGGTIAAAARRG